MSVFEWTPAPGGPNAYLVEVVELETGTRAVHCVVEPRIELFAPVDRDVELVVVALRSDGAALAPVSGPWSPWSDVSPLPEPSLWLGLIVGLVGLVFVRWWRRWRVRCRVRRALE